MQVEAAKTGFSKCQVCLEKIPLGAVRVGLPRCFRGTPGFSWHHIRCAEGLLKDDEALKRMTALAALVDKPVDGVYVLRLNGRDGAGDCYYVGKSGNVDKRTAEHRSLGPGCAAWVRLHGGVAAVEAPVTPREELASWEQKETIARILRHGFDKVRGWEWTFDRPFGPDEYAAFKACACGNGDLCRRCGNPGHFVRGCTEALTPWMVECNARPTVPACGRCGRTSHAQATCFAATDLRGHRLARSDAPKVVEPAVSLPGRLGRIETSQEFGCLGDAVSSLRLVPREYVERDLETIRASDDHDNATLRYGPDSTGHTYAIEHYRKWSWFSHKCVAIAWKNSPLWAAVGSGPL